MSDLKRRKLGDNQNRQGQSQGQPRSGQNRPQQGRPQQQGRNRNQRPQGSRPTFRPPPPPPAFMQRDLLLVVALGEGQKAVEEVRAKFDPLSKKLPAHITLLSPEPLKSFDSQFLKAEGLSELPSLNPLTFTHVLVHDEMYLWLVPDEESRAKINQWREKLLGILIEKSPEHTQDAEFIPHLTLGYIPRSMTPEEAVLFATNLIKLPLIMNFEKVLLEEFSENQISTSIDSLIFASN